MQLMQTTGVSNAFNLLTQAFRNPFESNFQGFHHGLLMCGDLAFLPPFLSENLGCAHEVFLLFWWDC